MHDNITTESVNAASDDLDRLTTLELVHLVNREDATIAAAVTRVAGEIAAAIDRIHERLAGGGRLVYIGAGTSGRLGALDAAECVPTFSCEPGQVLGLIAGGERALTEAVEGAEDSPQAGADDLRGIDLSSADAVVGIAASGRTPYVLGGLDYAREVGAAAIGLSCNEAAPIVEHADLVITVVTGAEVLSGSTRMKAGTATKMVLNMLTTGAMVRLGKTYGNLMVDLHASNEKLRARTLHIIGFVTGLSDAGAAALLKACDGELKTAIVSAKLGLGPAEARERLAATAGRLREALDVDGR